MHNSYVATKSLKLRFVQTREPLIATNLPALRLSQCCPTDAHFLYKQGCWNLQRIYIAKPKAAKLKPGV
jgi:hypothetical protein